MGEIPENWGKTKIKHLFTVVAGATPESTNESFWDGDIAWITPADFKTSDHFVEKGRKTITVDGYNSCATTLVPQGSIIFSKRAPIGSVVIAKAPLCTNQGCLSCVPKPGVSSDFYYYAMSVFTDAFEMKGSGTTFKEISAFDFSDFPMPCPSLKEQETIAAYLDHKVGQIDKSISEIDYQIDSLKAYRQSIISEAVTKGLDKNAKMKDSGIEWIGDIPEGWAKLRFKNFIDQITTPSNSPRKVALENIESRTGRYLKTESEFEGNGIDFRNGDVVYGKLRPYLQKVWLAEFDGNAVGDVYVYRVKQNCLDIYLKYILLSDNFTSVANGSTKGAKMPRVSADFISNMIWFLPPVDEQERIACYLETKSAQIDEAVSALEDQRGDLNALKQAVISEAVTGKIDVRDWTPSVEQ